MTTVLDDYAARSSQELTVSKGQHVRVIQKQPPNAPDWCLIRLLNDQHHQQQQHQQHQIQSTPSSLAASSTTITSGSGDLSAAPSSKYTEGLVPAAILKSTKSSSTSVQLPPPLSHPLSTSKSEQSKRKTDLIDISRGLLQIISFHHINTPETSLFILIKYKIAIFENRTTIPSRESKELRIYPP